MKTIQKSRKIISIPKIYKFCENIKANIEKETALTKIDKDEENKKLKNLNKFVNLEKLDDKVKKDVEKYKVFEDSIGPTVDRIKDEVPEIANHKEFRDYIDKIILENKQEELLNKEGIVILRQKSDVLQKYNVDLHNYKNYQDRDYEVDIEEVLTKDLFENKE
jgi:hypothetical protein